MDTAGHPQADSGSSHNIPPAVRRERNCNTRSVCEVVDNLYSWQHKWAYFRDINTPASTENTKDQECARVGYDSKQRVQKMLSGFGKFPLLCLPVVESLCWDSQRYGER
jgi:hypothetical protein